MIVKRATHKLRAWAIGYRRGYESGYARGHEDGFRDGHKMREEPPFQIPEEPPPLRWLCGILIIGFVILSAGLFLLCLWCSR